MIIKALRSFLMLTGIIILGTCFLVFLVLSFLEFGHDLGKILILVFSVMLGVPVAILFLYLIRRREWVALLFIIYLAIVAIIFPLTLEYFRGSPYIIKIERLIDFVGMESIVIFFAAVLLLSVLKIKNRYIFRKVSELFENENAN